MKDLVVAEVAWQRIGPAPPVDQRAAQVRDGRQCQKAEGKHILEVGAQLVERFALGMGAGDAWDDADIEAGVGGIFRCRR